MCEATPPLLWAGSCVCQEHGTTIQQGALRKQLTPAWAICSCQGPQLWCRAVQSLCQWLHAAGTMAATFDEGPVAESWGIVLQTGLEDKTRSPVLQHFLETLQHDGISVKLAGAVTKVLMGCWTPASHRLSSCDLNALLANAQALVQEEVQASLDQQLADCGLPRAEGSPLSQSDENSADWLVL